MKNRYCLFRFLLIPVMLVFISISGRAQTISRYSIDDAVVSQTYPDSVIDQSKIGGNIKAFRVKNAGGTFDQIFSYVKFDISALKGFMVESATVSYRGKTGDANFNDLFKLALYSVNTDWQGDTVSWNFRPATGSSKLDTSFLNASSARKDFLTNGTGLVNYINEEIRKGKTTISFAIKSFGKDSTDNMWIGGTANGNYGPILNCILSPMKGRYAIDDAVVMEAFPDSVINQANIGGNIKAFRKRDGGTLKQTFSYIKFDISDLAGTQLETATISYRGKTGDANYNDLFKLALYTVTKDWQGDTVTWQYRPSTGSSKLDTSFLNSSSARKTFLTNGTGLLNYINEEIRKGSKTVSFALKSFGKDSTDNMWIGGTANGNYGPILDFTITASKSKYAVDDAVVMQAYPDSVIDQSAIGGNIKAYRKRNQGGTYDQTFSYIKFDISELQGVQVESATLSYRGKTGDANYVDLFKLALYTVTQEWQGDTVKYSTRPSTGSSKMDTSFLNTSSARKDFLTNGTALVNYINEEIRKGSKSISFALKSFGKDTTDNMWIGGMANGNYGPILNLTLASGNSNYCVDDAVVMQAYPDSVIDQSQIGGNLKVYRKLNAGGTYDQTFSYVKFDISGLNSLQIENAKVSYRGKTGDANYNDLFKLALYSVTQDWMGDTVTWLYKPSTGSTKMDTSFLNSSSARKDFLTNGTKLEDFINEEIRKGNKTIGLVIKSFGKDSTDNMWIGGKANGNYGPILDLTYQNVYGSIPPAPVVLSPAGGTFIQSVRVMLVNKPPRDTVFYETGKTTVADPTRNSAIFPDTGLVFTDTTMLKVIPSRDGIYGEIVTGIYNLIPVDVPQFSPSPAVKYQKQVLVTITVYPSSAIIYYSLDGSEPGEPYIEPILLTKTTTIRAAAYSADFTYITPVVEATYQVVNTEDLPGTGPAGVGFRDLTRTNQPEVGLWLKPEALTGYVDGNEVLLWNDMSGNANNAVNTYTGTPEPILNTGESTKPAPAFIADGLNGFPVLNFGVQSGEGNLRAMTVPDADNLDGGFGISIFMVLKRNEMFGDFAALIQKRDIRGSDPARQAFTLEMDGGANPNKIQFVLARDLFLKNAQVINTDNYYIINVNQQGVLQTASFITNGNIEGTNFYNQPVQATDATLILGGFQPMNVAELILINSDMNMAQINLVANYLAAKYGLTLTSGNLFDPGNCKYDIIGLGKARNITDQADDEQLYSSGGALELKAANIENAGDYIFAGHDGIAIAEDAVTKQWSRTYYLQNAGNISNVTMGFDYGNAGLSTVPDNSFKLLYKVSGGDAWTNMGIVPSYNAARNVLSFELTSVQTGYYTVTKFLPTGIESHKTLAELKIYPNPAIDMLTIDLENDAYGPVEFRILDITGRTLRIDVESKSEYLLNRTMDISDLDQGAYLLEVRLGSIRLIRMFNKN